MLRKTFFTIALIALLAGFALSIVSWLELCTEMCVGTHNYRLFGMKFQTIGLIFFPLLIISHLLSWRVAGLLLAGALGSELIFIWVQKYEIKAWCPICLSIAGTLAVAGLAYAADFLTQPKKDPMNQLKKSVSTLAVFAFGLLVGIVGVSKINPLEAMEDSVKENIIFGDKNSPVEVYVFTDWQCPACRKLESKLPDILAAAEKEARVVFVDVDIHPETLNFIPYNLSFMIHDKKQYLTLRDLLMNISKTTAAPTENQVEAAIKPLGVTYEELNYADVAVGMKYFKHLADEFDINSTPTVVLVNTKTKKGKKFFGTEEISRESVMEAISQLKH